MTPQPVRKAVFPAAGLGTRFLPATKAQPKEMLTIVDKPQIQYGVEEAEASGIDLIVLVTGRGKQAIENHFDRAVELEELLTQKKQQQTLDDIRKINELAEFVYVRQRKALGLGHAVGCAERIVGDEPFAVILGDDLIDAEIPATRQLIDVYTKMDGPVIALMEVAPEETSKYGVVKAKDLGGGVYEIEELVEKPAPGTAPSNLAIIGRYVLTPDIFPAIHATAPDANGEIQLTNALRALKEKRKLYGCAFKGRRYDGGNKLGFLQATVEFALKRPDLGPEFRAYLKSLKL
jgi:UTP--glucose-1-phosphate uridylyltransferase